MQITEAEPIRKVVSLNAQVVARLFALARNYPDDEVGERARRPKVVEYAESMRAGTWRAIPNEPGDAINITHRRPSEGQHRDAIKAVVEHGGESFAVKLEGPATLLRRIVDGEALPGLDLVRPAFCPFAITNGNHRLRAIGEVSPQWVDVEIVAPPEFFEWLESNVAAVIKDEARRREDAERSRKFREAQAREHFERVNREKPHLAGVLRLDHFL